MVGNKLCTVLYWMVLMCLYSCCPTCCSLSIWGSVPFRCWTKCMYRSQWSHNSQSAGWSHSTVYIEFMRLGSRYYINHTDPPYWVTTVAKCLHLIVNRWRQWRNYLSIPRPWTARHSQDTIRSWIWYSQPLPKWDRQKKKMQKSSNGILGPALSILTSTTTWFRHRAHTLRIN